MLQKNGSYRYYIRREKDSIEKEKKNKYKL